MTHHQVPLNYYGISFKIILSLSAGLNFQLFFQFFSKVVH